MNPHQSMTPQEVLDLINSQNPLLLSGGKLQITLDGGFVFSGASGNSVSFDSEGNVTITYTNQGFGGLIEAGVIGFIPYLRVRNSDVDAITLQGDGNLVATGTVTGGRGFAVRDNIGQDVIGLTTTIVVLTESPVTFKTLHFTGGILTSIT